MKFVIITDIHMGPEGFFNGVLRKITKDVKQFLDKFIDEMNDEVRPAFVVVLGDLIEDDNPENDKTNITFITKLFKKLDCPVYFAAGNHDLKNISEDELTSLFFQEKLFYSYDNDNYHFIVLFSKVVEKGNILISDEQIRWLKNDLEQTSKKCIIFVHHGLSEQNLKGNLWFEDRPEYCLVKNRKEIRNILEKSDKVLAVFNSHLHWDKMDLHNSIPYFTLQSLVENENDKGLPSQAFHVVSLNKDKINVEIRGNYPKFFTANLKK